MKLSSEDLQKFKTEGWIGPFPILEIKECANISTAYRLNKNKFFWPKLNDDPQVKYQSVALPWFKSMHCFIEEFRELVSKPILLDILSQLIGDNIIAWGATVTQRSPGQKHRWHGDIEHFKWSGISAFIGLEQTTKLSSLKIIPGSHLFGYPPQSKGELSDMEITTLARLHNPATEVLNIPCQDGEFFLFDGRLWHGSENLEANTRLAIIAQFASTTERIVLPLNYNEPVAWADDEPQPPCLLVRGRDNFNHNNLIYY